MMKWLKWIALVVVLAVIGGIVYVDTYPTYFAKKLVLTPDECGMVATIVAAAAYKQQNPGEVVPEKAQELMQASTRKAKRVAEFILMNHSEILTNPPMFIYTYLYQGCLASDGVADLSK